VPGGLGFTSGYGSPGNERQVALTGAQSASQAGFLATIILDGAAATFGLTAPGKEMTVRLRARKVGGGTATFQLTGLQSDLATQALPAGISYTPLGQAGSAAYGSLGKGSARLMTGERATAEGGLMTASGGAVSTLDNDWIARSTAAGVFSAEQLSDSSRVALNSGAGGANAAGYVWTQPQNVSFDTTIKRSGSGSVRITIPASSGADPGSLHLPTGQLRGNGTTTYYQFSIYTPEAFLRYKPTHSNGSGGWKSMIASHTSGSNQTNEVVVQDIDRRGVPQVYWQDGTQFVAGAVSANTPCNPGNFEFNNAVDRGAPATITTCDQYESRYGLLYDNPSHPGGTNSAPAGSDSFAAGFPYAKALIAAPTWKINGWNTILLRVTIGTLGTASSTIEMWHAQTGSAYTKLCSLTNVLLGTANGGHNCVWLLPYETARNPNSVPQDTFVCYAESIASTQFINAPAVADTWTPPYSLPTSAGQVVAIGTNTSDSIAPNNVPAGIGSMSATQWNYALFDSWNGAALIEDYSRGGGIVIAGSGAHGAPRNVGAAIFDLADATWKRLDPTTGGTYSGTDYTVAETTGSPYYEVAGGTGTPAPGHTYQLLCPWPANAGGGVKGSVLRVVGAAMCQESVTTAAAHAMSLSTGKWSRPTGTTLSDRAGAQSSAEWDPGRRRWWYMPDGVSAYSNIQYIDAETMTWQTSANYPSHVSTGAITLYGTDYLVGLRSVGGTKSWHVLDLNNITAGWVLPTVSGSPGTDYDAAWVYHPGTGKLYQMSATGGATLRRMTPPANPITGTWVADTITLGSSLPALWTQSTVKPGYKWMFYAPALGCLVYIAGGAGGVRLIKPE